MLTCVRLATCSAKWPPAIATTGWCRTRFLGRKHRTPDAFLEHDVTVYAEVKVEFDIRCTLKANRWNSCHEQASVFDQCRRWLRTHLPDRVGTGLSTSRTCVERAANEPGVAAIGSEIAGDIYGFLPSSVVSKTAATTSSFLVIAREAAAPRAKTKHGDVRDQGSPRSIGGCAG